MNLQNYFHTGDKVYADNPARSFILFQSKSSPIQIATGDNPAADAFLTIEASKSSQAIDLKSISGRIHVHGDCAILTDCPLVEFVAPALPNPVTGFTLTADTLTLNVGDTGTATVSAVTPVDADTTQVVFVSKDKSMVEIDYSTGEYVAKKSGSVVIQAWMDSVVREVTLTVRPALESFDIDVQDASIAIAGTQAYSATNILPAGAITQNIVWSSSDEGIASFAGNTATGVSAGVVVVTATDETGIVATTTLTVTA